MANRPSDHHPARASLAGLHHVTALTKHPAADLAFHTAVLGARLVKRTVNFDDPTTHHLYYGNDVGSPGTLLTTFPHPMAASGTPGTGAIRRALLRVAPGGLGPWARHLADHGVEATEKTILGLRRLELDDPAGFGLALVEAEAVANGRPVPGPFPGPGDVPPLLGLAGAELHVPAVDELLTVLRGHLGFELVDSDGHRHRLRSASGSDHGWLEVVADDASPPARMGAGSIHHVAWRVPDDETRDAVADALREAGLSPTETMDRLYFRSVYVRMPGSVIFELATDGPGFAIDEAPGELGSSLKLPPRFEARRAAIERSLPPLER